MNPVLFAAAIKAIVLADKTDGLRFTVPRLNGWQLTERVVLVTEMQVRWQALNGSRLGHVTAEIIIQRGYV